MMRGIAAMMVAYFHIARGNPNYLDTSNLFFQVGAYGWAGVEIFFVISGFIITYAMFHGGYKLTRVHKFLAKRLIRLEPPYIISIVLVMLLMYVSTLSPHYRGQPLNFDWWNIIGHLGYVNAFTGAKWLQDVYWSLAIEFEFYLGLALLYPLLVHKTKTISLCTMLALVGMTFVPAGESHVFQYLPFFCMGILLSLRMAKKYSNTEFSILFAIVAAICYYKFGHVLTGLGALTILVISFLKTVPKQLAWLGHISYSLYLLHIPIGGRIINISEVLIKNQNLRVVMVFVALAVTLICAHFFYKLVEKPFQNKSKSIKY